VATVLATMPASANAATPAARELPGLPGYTGAEATAVNNAGTVVGYSVDANYNSIAVKWSPSDAVTDLGTLPGDTYSEALGINNLGQIAGFSGSVETGVQHAVEWNAAGVIKDLGASEADGINDFGEAVGFDNPGPREVNAVLWRNGNVDDFGAAETDAIGDTYATAVNDLGQIAGADFVIHGDGSREAVRWNADGSHRQLPFLVDARDADSGANAINNLAVVVGNSPTAVSGQTHAVRWDQHGAVTDLGTVPGGVASFANGINDLGLIVGSANDANVVGHAVTWSRTGSLTELPDLPGGSNSEALAVSDGGFIVGDGNDAAGNDVAIRWH